ncbi:MAG: hypothetical protein JXA67_06475 [Micromonosporaceae bacterium]|nr:hypothetical protein [Micromonosporaceae bacterium]
MNAHRPLNLREGLSLAEHIDSRDGVIQPFRRVRLGRRWAAEPLSCQTCGESTHGRDAAGNPIHPDCAERWLSAQLGGEQ